MTPRDDKKKKINSKNEVKNNTSENSDLYPANENIDSENAQSSYYTPFGD